jgi:hypothetical protein
VLVFITERNSTLLGSYFLSRGSCGHWQLTSGLGWLMVPSIILINTESFISQGMLSIFLHMNPLHTFVFNERRPSARRKAISKPILYVALCIGRWKVNKQVELR